MEIKSQAFGTKIQLIILLIIAFGLNFNTLFHQYALDDFVVMTENKYVEKGIYGIPEIFANDLMSGCTTKENLLSQPRYRPFTLVIFALEHQLFGENPFVSHLLNVILFMLMTYLLFRVLNRYVFRKQNEYLAFITCLLYVVHPIHTEVIANVKSRDEIISFIFLLITLIAWIKYFETRKLLNLWTGLFCFFLALLTRESALTFIGVAPLILYFFCNVPIKKLILLTIPLILVFAAYMMVRYSVIGFNKPHVSEILNSPYLYATNTQAFATKVFVLLKYLMLLVFPYTLAYDYSYNQIPYIEIYSLQFVISILVLAALIMYAIYTFKRKSIVSFSILYFFITISLVANFVFDIGTPLSERLLFQPSLAYCIVFAFLFLKIFKKIKSFSVLILISILVLFSIKTIARNSKWKNNETLFITDVISAPNSSRTTFAAAEIYRFKAENETDEELRAEYLHKAIKYCEKSIEINPANSATYLSLGFAYFDGYNYNKAAELFMQGFKLDTASSEAKICLKELSTIFYKQGNGLSENDNVAEAIKRYLKAIELNNENIEAWYNLGGNYFLINDSIKAIAAWENVRKLDPDHPFNMNHFYSH